MKNSRIGSEPHGRLAENILHFCRTLRHAGLPVGPGTVVDALTAVAATGIRRSDDFRAALCAVLVKDQAGQRLFDQGFHLYFRDPGLLERMLSILPLMPRPEPAAAESAADEVRRLIESLTGASSAPSGADATENAPLKRYSATETLRHKDFEKMSAGELAEARRMLREQCGPASNIATRRYRASASGGRYDLRRSMRSMARNDGQLIQLARRRRLQRPPPLVLLCDVSGSMSRYSRMFLHYAHALSTRYRNVRTFVFGTRLTNISRWLRDRDVDRALLRVSAEVPDWDGGTRIADSLRNFNLHWGRRVLGGNATVVLLCDGLERNSQFELEFQMQRLRRSCRRLIWMNPLLRYAEFEPRASGISAMLPNVDRFVAAHNVASMTDVGRMLADSGSRLRAHAGSLA